MGVTKAQFGSYIQEMRTYRDKFVAHLDSDEVAHVPDLTMTLESVSFLYDYILGNEGPPNFFPDAIKPATALYKKFLEEGKKAYES